MTQPIEVRKVGDLTIKIYHDDDCESPLDADDGAIKITYRAGARTVLGNTPDDGSLEINERQMAGELVALPVYAYVHGGVSLRAGYANPFGCQWDSGMSGWVYCTTEWANENLQSSLAEQREYLANEVERFGQWLNGECYGFEIVDAHGDVLEDCWGFIGYQWVLDEALARAKAIEDSLPKQLKLTLE